MTAEFVPLEALLDSVHASLLAAGDRMERRQEGDIAFTVGECTVGLSVELQSDGDRVTARFPSALDGDLVPPEYLSRITFTLRRGVTLETPG